MKSLFLLYRKSVTEKLTSLTYKIFQSLVHTFRKRNDYILPRIYVVSYAHLECQYRET